MIFAREFAARTTENALCGTMAEEYVETEHPGVLLYAQCHASYAPESGSGMLLELVEGDIVAVVQEKPETGWCVSRLKRCDTAAAMDCHPSETATRCAPAGILDSY